MSGEGSGGPPRLPLEGGRPRGDVRAEIEHYLEERAREFEDAGMEPEEARRAARKAFGDVERIESEVRGIDAPDRTTTRRMTMGSWIQDLRFALRGALRRPGLTAVIVLTLGLGIGATTAIFTVVNASIIRALPFDDADDLVFLQGAYDAPEGPQVRGTSYPETMDWREGSRSFTGVTPFDGTSVTLTGVDRAERIPTELVGSGYFDLLRVQPILGRTFLADEHDLDGTGRVVLLGEGLWERRFGSDPGILGRTLTLSGEGFTVVGVLPGDFPGASLTAEMWMPLEASGFDLERGSRYLGVLARLRPGVTVDEAQADMDALTTRLEETYPTLNEDRVGLVTPLREAYLGDTRTLMLVILSATGLLLLIAAANVTNLLLVRASGRRSEMLVRRALGAGRGRIGRQLLTESLVLAALGTAVGLALGLWGAELLAGLMPDALLPAYVDVSPDLRVLAFTAGLLAFVGVLGGLAPALQAAGSEVGSRLRSSAGGRGQAGGRRSLQNVMVVGEVALAFLLLVGAGLMTRSFLAQLGVDPGYDAERLHAFSVVFSGDRYDAETREAAALDLLARLEARPEVQAAALANDAPLTTGYSAAYIWMEGTAAEDRIRFYRHHVSPGYFETLGIPIVRGRALTAADETPVAVISQAMATRHFGTGNAVGRNLVVGGPDGTRIQIVGVAGDVRYRDLTTDLVNGATDPDVYLPWTVFSTGSVAVVTRTRDDPAALEQVVREVVASLDPDLAVFNSGPLSRGLEAATAQGRFGSLLLGIFSVLAILLCALGLYGVLSFTVARRTRELAVRVAMGAPVSRIRWMVMRHGMVLLGVGLLVGLAATLAATRALEVFLFGVGARDVTTYGLVALGLGAVTVFSTWLPALRATRVDPQRALTVD